MAHDPLAHTNWSRPQTVAGFAASPPNLTLMQVSARERERGGRRLLDIGCGAGRNAIPLAEAGWEVVGTDYSLPMVEAAAARAQEANLNARFILAPMESLPFQDESFDLIVAHGIWNLAESTAQFRQAVREAARLAAPDAGLFVFTFSRNTISAEAEPVEGEEFVFTEFSGQRQTFLTEDQLIRELAAAGFERDPSLPLLEHNLPPPGKTRLGGPPVIYEALFRYRG